MAKRSPANEEPFRPLNASLLSAVVKHSPDVRLGSIEPHRRFDSTAPAKADSNVRPVERSVPSIARLDQEKRVLFTRSEAQIVERLINNLSGRLQAQIKASHVMRALTVLLLNAESQIYQRAGERGPLTRPPNGDFAALQRFERELAMLLADALRDAGQLR